MDLLLWVPGLVLAPCMARECSDPKAEQETAITALEKIATKVVRDKKIPGKPVIELRLLGQEVTDKTLVQMARNASRKLRLRSGGLDHDAVRAHPSEPGANLKGYPKIDDPKNGIMPMAKVP